MSLRARLLLTTVGLVAVALLVAGFATTRALHAFLIDRVDEQLLAVRLPAAEALQTDHPFGPGPTDAGSVPSGTFAVVVDASGQVLASREIGFHEEGSPTVRLPALPGGLPGSAGTAVGERFFTVAGEHGSARILATSLGANSGTLIVGIPLHEVRATVARLVVIELVVGVVVLVALAAIAAWLTRLGLRPLDDMGRAAGEIAAGDLSRRVEPADERTEVGRLGLALNAMLTQIETAFEERRASETRLRRFAADASHELRTPLTSIRGYAELFRRGAGRRPEDLARSMERIEQEAARMGVLVDDLLLLARMDQGRPIERAPVDLSSIVAVAVDAARTVEPDRPIELAIATAVTVDGDAAKLRQVVDNLLDNVRVHTPARAPVRVEVSVDGADAVLTVTDSGGGLSAEEAERIFERFYRGDPARSRSTGGAGLGLSIVATIVEAHAGTVEARPAPEHAGLLVVVRLPVAAPPRPV